MLYFKFASADVKLANETHSHQGFKFYTFSNLILMNKRHDKSGLCFERAFFILSSPDDRFIKSFAEGLLQQPEFYLDGPKGKANLGIERIEILKDFSFEDECWFKTLSPIYVKTIRKENESLREIDLYPTEPKFYENLHKNLIERFSEFYGKAPADYFDVIETADIKPKRIKIAESYRRCNLMSLKIQASSELLKFAYEAGLGEKNAMGFGCVDVVNSSQQMKNLTADERR
ncbi:CRISPR-associated endoribonuclease [Candidatus Methanoperedens nitroreducens]|uniref:CRISPR-associated endoribonuclease n=2 Tax=Candidatus Methanoperedens nitratireducens TaxID=1392998 RepID=A0A284VPR5_9EURY|nr:CRISPR-associated endoribonuclease Cas6 [Candidatus Methanoperedens nitroreducens]SNQ61193.1 CRISPR-associated endoribonuclease [Candidatus Methanoperedens nitroreducens]